LVGVTFIEVVYIGACEREGFVFGADDYCLVGASVNVTVHQLNRELSKRSVGGELPVEVIEQFVIVVAGNPAGGERGAFSSALEIIVASGGGVAVGVDESERDSIIINRAVRAIDGRSGENLLDNQVLELSGGWLSCLKTSHTDRGKIVLLRRSTRRNVRFLGDGISGGHETGDEAEESEELHFDRFAGGGFINSDRMDGWMRVMRSTNVDRRDFWCGLVYRKKKVVVER